MMEETLVKHLDSHEKELEKPLNAVLLPNINMIPITNIKSLGFVMLKLLIT